MTRPEAQSPPEYYFNDEESRKYATNSRLRYIQTAMSNRAIELVTLPDQPSLVLDIGCGSGISGEALSNHGHMWIGCDISQSMLNVGIESESFESGDALLADIGHALNFRAGSFDAAISISAIQWLFNAEKKSHEPIKRIRKFFQWLFAALSPGARAALQFYPQNATQLNMLTQAATRSGFNGGILVDFPNSTKAKKYFLVIWAGTKSVQVLPKPLLNEHEIQENAGNADEDTAKKPHLSMKMRKKLEILKRKKQQAMRKNPKLALTRKMRVLDMKQKRVHKGFDVKRDSKYTGRKRKDRL